MKSTITHLESSIHCKHHVTMVYRDKLTPCKFTDRPTSRLTGAKHTCTSTAWYEVGKIYTERYTKWHTHMAFTYLCS